MSISVQQMADRVADLMETRLQVKGASLSEKVKRGGHHLPRRVREAASILARNDETSRIPKLFRQVDLEGAALAYDVCVRHLNPLGASTRRANYAWSVLRTLAGGLAVTCVVGATLLAWRGYL